MDIPAKINRNGTVDQLNDDFQLSFLCCDVKVNLWDENPWARTRPGPRTAFRVDLLCKTEKRAQRTKGKFKII